MGEKMMDQQFLLYVLAGICAVVLLQKMIVTLLYRNLKKATEALPSANSRWIKQLKLKFENTYKLTNEIPNVEFFVDRQVDKMKFFKVGLHGMETFYRKAQLVCIFLGGLSYVLAAGAGKTVADCNAFFMMGILAAVVIQFLDNLSGNAFSAEGVRLNLKDYFANSLAPKLAQDELRLDATEERAVRRRMEPEMAEDSPGLSGQFLNQRRQQREETAAAEVRKRAADVFKDNLSKEEEDRIVRDVLKEFLT